ncbi:VgrG-related protein [Pseudactinotalea sp. HY158]|nr:VgrG-related protein [Pseudactinotalea sp. HY158]
MVRGPAVPEGFSYAVVVKVDGCPLPAQVAERITEAYVDDSVHLPALVHLRFSDPHDRVLSTASIKIGAALEVAVQSSRPGPPEPLITATVTALEREIDARGQYTIVRGLDHRHKLQGATKVTSFTDQKVSDIATTVARAAGLTCKASSIGPIYPHVLQDGRSDWDFLCRLAADHGAVIAMEGTTLTFGQPTKAATAAGGPTEIDVADQVIHLRSTVTASGQVQDTEVHGWDPKAKQAVVGRAPAASTSAQLSQSPATLGRSGGTQLLSAPGLVSQAQAEARAKAEMAARAGGFAELDARLRGNPALHAGTAITLKGAGAAFDGMYALTAARHTFDAVNGYVTDVTVAAASERSGYGVVSAGNGAAATEHPAHRGLLPAIVTDLNDPEKHGRVRVKFPTLDDAEQSWWARVMQTGAGAKRGGVVLPEVNDEVLVAFADGDAQSPYVLGGLYNGKDQPLTGWPQTLNSRGQVIRRSFTSRTGMFIEMFEDEGGATLTIATKNSDQRLILTQSPQGGIELASTGPIDIKADGAIAIESKQKLSLAGMDVAIKANAGLTMEATGAAKLTGSTVAVEAQATATVKGNASAELSSSGQTVVRGSIVRIN